jgi:signal transduction histidine kinase
VFLVTLTVIFLGTRSLLHRFTILEQGLSAVLEGNYEYRLPEGGSDELGFLCRSFNTMLDGLAGQRAAREQAEAEKRAIIAGLSHDLRTPLASIMGYAESIRDNPDETAGEIREQAEIIHSKSVYMESLIQELLDFSFSEYSSTSPQLEVFDCNEFVRTIIIGFLPRMREKAISLEVELPEQPYWVRADKNMLARAFENLLSNAIRYVPSDGSLWVAAHRGDTQRSEPAGGADTVRIAIANNGPPIAEEDREHIFENFYRGEPSRHGRGLGLGLTIARNILRSLDGELLLERSDKTATVFTVILPVCNQHP